MLCVRAIRRILHLQAHTHLRGKTLRDSILLVLKVRFRPHLLLPTHGSEGVSSVANRLYKAGRSTSRLLPHLLTSHSLVHQHRVLLILHQRRFTLQVPSLLLVNNIHRETTLLESPQMAASLLHSKLPPRRHLRISIPFNSLPTSSLQAPTAPRN